MLRAIDVSSYQPTDLTGLIEQHNVDLVVVRLYLPWESPPQDISIQQIQSVQANGKQALGYVWCYRSADPRATIAECLALARGCGLELPILPMDCETYNPTGHKVEDPGPDAAWLRAALDECQQQGVRPAIYTALWWLEEYLPDYSEFTNVLLWLADYNGVPDLASVLMPWGWPREMLWGHQYSADGIDLDVFRSVK